MHAPHGNRISELRTLQEFFASTSVNVAPNLCARSCYVFANRCSVLLEVHGCELLNEKHSASLSLSIVYTSYALSQPKPLVGKAEFRTRQLAHTSLRYRKHHVMAQPRGLRKSQLIGQYFGHSH